MSSDNPYESQPVDENPFSSPQILATTAQPPAVVSMQGLEKTKSGLQLVYYGILLILIAAMLMIFGAIITSVLRGPGANANTMFALMGIIVLYGAVLIGGLLMFIGQCLCLTVPAESRARGLIQATVILKVVSLLLFPMLAVLSFGGFAPELFAVVALGNLANMVLGLIGFFCFLNFISVVNSYINRPELVQYARSVIILFGLIIAGYIAMLLVVFLIGSAMVGRAPAGAGIAGMITGIFGLVLLVMVIVAVCRYTTLLRKTVNAIGFVSQAKKFKIAIPN